LYGYLNGVRSSRKLEKSAIELRWLCVELFQLPQHLISENKSIGIKKTFQTLCFFLKDADLIAGRNHCYRWYKKQST
jgi:hypothetical protein